MNSVLSVGLYVATFVGILSLVLTKSSFDVQSTMFIYREPSAVYDAISDITTIKKFHPFIASHVLVKKDKSSNGTITEYHIIKDQIPVYGNYTLPVTLDIRMEMTKPKEVLTFDYTAWYGTTSTHMTWTVKPRAGERGPGTLLNYTSRTTCPWVTSAYTEGKARESVKDNLYRMRLAIEGLDVGTKS